ncbi:hypothetical protein [Saccharomonospora marina]|uniref:hypothetical protein n=1 Tax=Saccharomonospora marina TaxID=632569 RepID=UPI00031A1215|nr:hypothetical protein [Saccharomonospora marina]
MAGEYERRDDATGRLAPDEPPELVAEIRTVEGIEAQRLAAEQARVLWEVTQWQARNKSAHGLDDAA